MHAYSNDCYLKKQNNQLNNKEEWHEHESFMHLTWTGKYEMSVIEFHPRDFFVAFCWWKLFSSLSFYSFILVSMWSVD